MSDDDPPIRLTEAAAKKVLEVRAAEGIPAERVLRLCVRGGGCAGFSYDMFFDEPDPDIDRRFTLHGVEVAVDDMSLMYLAGTVVDWHEGLRESGFHYSNPNVTATCGCGSSFSA